MDALRIKTVVNSGGANLLFVKMFVWKKNWAWGGGERSLAPSNLISTNGKNSVERLRN